MAVVFKHDEKEIAKAIGFNNMKEIKDALVRGLETNDVTDDRFLVAFAYLLSKRGYENAMIIPTTRIFFMVLTHGIKQSHLVELIYRKLKEFNTDKLRAIVKDFKLALDIEIQIESLANQLHESINSSDNDSTKEH